MEFLRLDKLVSNHTGLSRKDAKKFIKSGFVKINGQVVPDAEFKVCVPQDEVEIKGNKINFQKFVYIMLNKPAGFVCSTRDGLSPTVLELVPDEILTAHKGIFPAGRLDKDSEGFVFLTNDGALAHEILSPKKHVPKYYLVKLTKPFDESYVCQFEQGIVLENGEKCLPAKVCGIENMPYCAFAELSEGKFHQLKRMFRSVENNVEYLFRTQIGGLMMYEKLALGEHLEMLHKDVENFKKNMDFLTIKELSVKFFSSYLINTPL